MSEPNEDLTNRRPRREESLTEFETRLRLLRRVSDVLSRLVTLGFEVIVEESAEGGSQEGVEEDYIVQYGDLRVRLVVCPNDPSPGEGLDVVDKMQLHLLQYPDTDAIVLVGDNETLQSWVFDSYLLNDRSNIGSSYPQNVPLEQLLSEYFNSNVAAVALPDFATMKLLPTRDELKNLLGRTIREDFERTRSVRARIPEKVSALESITDEDLAEITAEVLRALEDKPSDVVSEIMEEGELT